ADRLPPTRVARHEVRLDEGEGDAQVRLQVAPVDVDGNAARALAQEGVALQVLRDVVLDSVARRDLGTDQLYQLLAHVWAVGAGRGWRRRMPARFASGTSTVRPSRP